MTNVAIEPAVFERPITSNSESISKSRLRYQGCLVTSSSKNMTSRDVYHFCSSKVDCIRTVHQFQPGRFLVLLNDTFDVSQLIKNCGKDEPYSIKPFDKESYQAWILRYFQSFLNFSSNKCMGDGDPGIRYSEHHMCYCHFSVL